MPAPPEGPPVVVPRPRQADRLASHADRPAEGARAPVAAPSEEPALQSGRRVIFLLFLSLWLTTLVALLWFAAIAQARFPDMTDRVYYALAGDLLLPIVAWFVFKAMPRNRHVRSE